MSAASSTSPNTPNKDVLAKNAHFLACCFQCLKTTPEIDFKMLAEMLGLKNANVASTRFSQIRKQMSGMIAKSPTKSNSATKNTSPEKVEQPKKATPKKRPSESPAKPRPKRFKVDAKGQGDSNIKSKEKNIDTPPTTPDPSQDRGDDNYRGQVKKEEQEQVVKKE